MVQKVAPLARAGGLRITWPVPTVYLLLSTFGLLPQIHHYLGHSYIALKDVYRSTQPTQAADSSDGEYVPCYTCRAWVEVVRCMWATSLQAFPILSDPQSERDLHLPPLAAGWAGGLSKEQVEGARRNFALVQGVVQSLGGIPAMVSGALRVSNGAAALVALLSLAMLVVAGYSASVLCHLLLVSIPASTWLSLPCSGGLCGAWLRREGLHPVHRLPLPAPAGDQVQPG